MLLTDIFLRKIQQPKAARINRQPDALAVLGALARRENHTDRIENK